jgi:hypothetical protein
VEGIQDLLDEEDLYGGRVMAEESEDIGDSSLRGENSD